MIKNGAFAVSEPLKGSGFRASLGFSACRECKLWRLQARDTSESPLLLRKVFV